MIQRYQRDMDHEQITFATIENMAIDARVTLKRVLDESNVSATAFYRWKRGDGNMLPLTKMRIFDAAKHLADRAPA